MNTRDLLAEAKERLRIPELWKMLGQQGAPGKSCKSPFRPESSASFSVFDDGRRWRDFGTSEGGTAVDFLAKARGLSDADACREFIKLAGLDRPPGSPPKRSPTSSTDSREPAFDWSACLAAFTEEHRAKLALWRGYSLDFVEWLHGQGLIGLHDGERIALPVHGTDSRVIACHYRRKEDGSWRYYPPGTPTRPLTIGETSTANTIFAFESQWDALAVMDRLGWPGNAPADTAVIITRGASNGRLLAGSCRSEAAILAFPQNDAPRADGKPTPAEKWLAEAVAACGCRCLRVATPEEHKDCNDWTRAGATAEDLQRAIAGAVSIMPPNRAQEISPGCSDPLPEEREGISVNVPFPTAALPGVMREFVERVAASERVPAALPAVCALGVISAALGAGLEVVSGSNRTTRGNLYLLASAESGSGKSEVFRIVAAPLLEHQQKLLEDWKTRTAPAIQAELRIIEKECHRIERQAAKASDPAERERLRGELEYREATKAALTRKAAMPSILAQDVTTERLAVMLADNREQLFSASADARKVIENVLGRYNPGKTTDESLYLSAFSGDFIRVDRQGREPVILRRPCLTLAWFIQPDMAAQLFDQDSLAASGFLARLLVCHTHARPQRIEDDAQFLPSTLRDRWAEVVRDTLATFHHATEPVRIEASPEAMAFMIQFHNLVIDRRDADLADVGAFAARYAEQAWRLAVVLHAAEHGAATASHPISHATASRASSLVSWFIDQQLGMLAKGRAVAAEKLEESVVELIERNRERRAVGHITARDVLRARIVGTPEAAADLLAKMERDRLLIGEDIRPAHGGKTTRIFRAPQNQRNPVPG